MPRRLLGLLTGGLVLAACTPVASAAPATVKLRIEGASRTLFEGSVTTDVRPFQFTDSGTTHTCDGTTTGGQSGSPVPTRGAAITAASQSTPFTMTGTWFDAFGPSFSEIAGDDVTYDSNTGRFLAEYKNGQFAQVGSCADPIATGDDVLYAYATGAEQLLTLAGGRSAAPGEAVTLHVTDAGSGAAVAGATVDGHLSGADGAVTVGPYDAFGDHPLKATKPDAIRSNAVDVCVTNGADGYCGTVKPGEQPPPVAPCSTSGSDGLCGSPDTTPALGHIAGILDHQLFARGRAPRELRGTADADPSGLRDVRLRLTRNASQRCYTYDASRERLRRVRRCGAKRGLWFSVGDREAWSYLLPFRLPRGRYVLDVETTDGAGNRDSRLVRSRNRVVFYVGG